jgi:hypothetical protein
MSLRKFANQYETNLFTDISDTATNFSVKSVNGQSAEDFFGTLPGAENVILLIQEQGVGSEYIKVNTISGNSLSSVTRAQEASTALAFSSAAFVRCIPYKSGMEATAYIDEPNTYSQDQTYNGLINANDDIVMAANKGFDFSAVAGGGATGHLFDDYEEGDWTPAVAGLTASSIEGSYFKIGRMIYIHGKFTADGTGTASSADITGLPYTPKFNTAAVIGATGGLNITAGINVGGQIRSGPAAVRLIKWDIAAGTQNVAPGELTNNFVTQFQGVYEIA